MRHLTYLALLGTLLAGCAAPETLPVEDDPFQDYAAPAGVPVLRGLVIDEAIMPLAGALVTSGDLTTTTDAEGRFVFTDLPEGPHYVTAALPGYSTVQGRGEAVVDGGDLVRLQLQRLPGTEPRVATYDVSGFIACGAGTPLTFHTCPSTTEDESTISVAFDGTPDWVQIETTWDSTQPTGEQLYLLYFFCPQDDCSGRDHRWSEGTRDDAFIDRMQNVDGLTDMQAAVYASPGGPANGTGTAIDQEFTAYVTFWYNVDAPDEAWSFIQDGSYIMT